MIDTKKEITLREWIENFNRGDYDKDDFDAQVGAGWYDWFCKNESLPKRLAVMGKIIAKFDNPFLLDNYRVWFKNNCPMTGPLYDDMRFEPLDDSMRNKMYFLITLNDERAEGKYEIITARNEYRVEAISNNSADLIKKIDALADSIRESIKNPE